MSNGEIMSNPEDLQQFDKLYEEWTQARDEAEHAQNELDEIFRKSLTDLADAPAPTQVMQEKVDQLWFCESEKRGNLDEFISERFS